METNCVRCGKARDLFEQPDCPHCWGKGTAKTHAQVEREARREREYRSAEQRAELDFQQGAAERGRSVRGWTED